jgi:hypothetical protein
MTQWANEPMLYRLDESNSIHNTPALVRSPVGEAVQEGEGEPSQFYNRDYRGDERAWRVRALSRIIM